MAKGQWTFIGCRFLNVQIKKAKLSLSVYVGITTYTEYIGSPRGSGSARQTNIYCLSK